MDTLDCCDCCHSKGIYVVPTKYEFYQCLRNCYENGVLIECPPPPSVDPDDVCSDCTNTPQPNPPAPVPRVRMDNAIVPTIINGQLASAVSNSIFLLRIYYFQNWRNSGVRNQ